MLCDAMYVYTGLGLGSYIMSAANELRITVPDEF